MKIGELAKSSGVSRATIRFYMENGLLVPNESNGQYTFSKQDEEDLQTILKMKRQQFTLKEIQHYLSLKRMSNFIEPETIDECLRMMENKKLELSSNMEALKQSIAQIDEQIIALTSQNYGAPQTTGVPLAALPLLACPICGAPLLLENASLSGQYVFSGTLKCACSYHARIQNGVVCTENRYTGAYDHPNLSRGLYRNMGNDFNVCIQKCYNHIIHDLGRMDLSGKVVLESNINGYFYLYNHLDQFPDDCLFIVTDKYPEMLEMYKSLIELLNLNTQILYIADSETQFPLRPECIDLHISFIGENEYQLYHPNNFIQDIDRWMKQTAIVLGVYFSLPEASISRKNMRKKYPESSLNGHILNCFLDSYRNQGYQVQLVEVGTLEKTVQQFSFECHVDGEPMKLHYYKASR